LLSYIGKFQQFSENYPRNWWGDKKNDPLEMEWPGITSKGQSTFGNCVAFDSLKPHRGAGVKQGGKCTKAISDMQPLITQTYAFT